VISTMNAMNVTRSRWHVIETVGGKEKLARDAIAGRGRPTFLPLAEKTVLHARRKDVVHRPLYPNYLFVLFDPFDLSWGEILHMPGVWTIVGIVRPRGRPKNIADVTGANWRPYVGQPRPLPDGAVQWIKNQLEDTEDGFVLREPVETEGPALAKDTRVKIVAEDNRFRDFEGLVDFHEGTRVRVLLDFMGRSTPLIVERDSLAIVSQP